MKKKKKEKLRPLTKEEIETYKKGIQQLKEQVVDCNYQLMLLDVTVNKGYLQYKYEMEMKKEQNKLKELSEQRTRTMKLIEIYEGHMKNGVPVKDKEEKK